MGPSVTLIKGDDDDDEDGDDDFGVFVNMLWEAVFLSNMPILFS